MSDADDALAALRDARVKLFQACQRRDWLVKQKPVKLPLVDEANADIEACRADVQTAREAAQAAMGD